MALVPKGVTKGRGVAAARLVEEGDVLPQQRDQVLLPRLPAAEYDGDSAGERLEGVVHMVPPGREPAQEGVSDDRVAVADGAQPEEGREVLGELADALAECRERDVEARDGVELVEHVRYGELALQSAVTRPGAHVEDFPVVVQGPGLREPAPAEQLE